MVEKEYKILLRFQLFMLLVNLLRVVYGPEADEYRMALMLGWVLT